VVCQRSGNPADRLELGVSSSRHLDGSPGSLRLCRSFAGPSSVATGRDRAEDIPRYEHELRSIVQCSRQGLHCPDHGCSAVDRDKIDKGGE
jgi:hypothetical protein